MSKIMPAKMTIETFERRAREVHGDRFSYPKITDEWRGASYPITMVCNECGYVFTQKPTRHLRGEGCPRCNGRVMLSKEMFVKRARAVHGDKYDYSLANLDQGITSKITIICPKHGKFIQTASSHINGCGCPECARQQKIAIAEQRNMAIVRRLYKDDCDFSKTVYTGRRNKITVTCREHGDFTTTLPALLNGFGCPKCRKNMTPSENLVFMVLRDHFGTDDIVPQYSDDRYPYKCDFYVKSQDMFIEVNAFTGHYTRFYDKDDEECQQQLKKWLTQAKHKSLCLTYIDEWVGSDVEKIKTALDNGINYTVFWDSRSALRKQLREWAALGFPAGYGVDGYPKREHGVSRETYTTDALSAADIRRQCGTVMPADGGKGGGASSSCILDDTAITRSGTVDDAAPDDAAPHEDGAMQSPMPTDYAAQSASPVSTASPSPVTSLSPLSFVPPAQGIPAPSSVPLPSLPLGLFPQSCGMSRITYASILRQAGLDYYQCAHLLPLPCLSDGMLPAVAEQHAFGNASYMPNLVSLCGTLRDAFPDVTFGDTDDYPFAHIAYIPSRRLVIDAFLDDLPACWHDDDGVEARAIATCAPAEYVARWVRRDVRRKFARRNGLGLVVFTDRVRLDDAALWVAMGCPDGRDWERLYSWLPDGGLDLPEDEPVPRLGPGVNQIMGAVRRFQFDELYADERRMWADGFSYGDHGPLRAFLFANRYRYIGKLPCQLSAAQTARAFKIAAVSRGYSRFDVSLMREVIDGYGVRSIYDSCAGWGERMLCAFTAGVPYHGVDVNGRLARGYAGMMGAYGIGGDDGYVVEFGDSSVVKPDAHYDAVITCPPYGDTEIYSNAGAENLGIGRFSLWWDTVVENFVSMKPHVVAVQTNEAYRTQFADGVMRTGMYALDRTLVMRSRKASHLQRGHDGSVRKRETEMMLVFVRKDNDGM